MAVKKMRGITVFDFEIEGDYTKVAEVEKALKAFAAEFKANITKDVNVKVIAPEQAALTDRRGDKTGPVEKIVFRN